MGIVKINVGKLTWIHQFGEYCPWLDMAETDRSRTRNLREQLFRKLNIANDTAVCWVTGKVVSVKVAHILPDSTKTNVMKRLDLTSDFKNDVEASPNNFLILDSLLEQAFDAMQISFAPVDILHTSNLCLRIWDSNCVNNPVGTKDVPETIGDYRGAALNLPPGWTVSKRALSYHTLCCYIYQKHKGRLALDVNVPADFSSQTGDGKDTVRLELAQLYHSALRADNEAEEDDEDVLDNAIDDEDFEGVDDLTVSTVKKKKSHCVIM